MTTLPPAGRRTGRRGPAKPGKRGRHWRIQWTDQAGRRQSATYDTHDEAIKGLERVKGLIRLLTDGVVPEPPEPITFKRFAEDYYIPNRTMLKARTQDDLSILRKHLYPAFENVHLSNINLRVIEAFKAEKLKEGMGVKTLANHLTLLRAMLRYAEDMGFLLRAPKVKLPRLPEPTFNYLRTTGEILALLRAALEEGDGVMELLATAIYTGLRAGELFGLLWDDVNFDGRLIRVARSYDKCTKSGKVRYVPILDVLYAVLRDWRLRNPSRLVFPTRADTMFLPTPRVSKFAFKRCLRRAGLQDIRFHDLRHTFASHWAMNGGSREKLQEILGHASPIMTQRYRHLEPTVFASDRGIFGTEPIVKRGEGETVVPLKRGKARRQ